MAKNAVVSEELASKFKTEKETPYTRWVKAEGLDIIPSFYVQNLRTVELKPWARRDGNAILAHDNNSALFRITIAAIRLQPLVAAVHDVLEFGERGGGVFE